MLRRSDLYVVRLLAAPPALSLSQGLCDVTNQNNQRDASCFGNSRPCNRCLRLLDAMGVNRVIFSTGQVGPGGCIGCEVHSVRDLLRGAGHCSRGDASQRHLLPHARACHACE